MGTILLVGAVWLFLLALALGILRTAGRAERDAERRLQGAAVNRAPDGARRRQAAGPPGWRGGRGSAAGGERRRAGRRRGELQDRARRCAAGRRPSATLCLINRERRAHGLVPLSGNARLGRAAGRHAADMVRRGYFAHVSPEGQTFVDRLRDAGYLGRCAWSGRGDARVGLRHRVIAAVARTGVDAERATPRGPARPQLPRGRHRCTEGLAGQRARSAPPTSGSSGADAAESSVHRLSPREPEDPGPAGNLRRTRRRRARARGARGAGPPHPRARGLCAHRDARPSRRPSCSRAASGSRPTSCRRRCTRSTRAPSESLTLRPEGTAPVCRAYLEHGMHKVPQPVKLWYLSSFFRRERPQAGRFRQFWQVGAEAIGSDDPAVDAELILLLAELLEAVGARGLRLRLSSLGTPATRETYRARPPGLPARARGRAVRGGARAHRPQPAARVRRRPPRHAPGDGGRAAAARPPHGRGPRALRQRHASCSTARASPTRSTRRSCAGSTTTRARCSR